MLTDKQSSEEPGQRWCNDWAQGSCQAGDSAAEKCPQQYIK